MIEFDARPTPETARQKRMPIERRAIPRNEPVRFGQSFASSEGFKALFAEGIALVEEAAAYLDGPGREEAKALTRMPALAYANESMRLTTRLMQMTSWLLIQKAARDGAISAEALEHPRYRLIEAPTVKLSSRIPEALSGFSRRADRLYERISRMDRQLYVDVEPAANPVATQLERLRNAFAG